MNIEKRKGAKKMKKFYMVICERGHCGCGHSTDIKFAFEAVNLLSAMDMAKKMPSVKHSKPCVKAWEISKEEYNEYISISAYERVNMGRVEPKKQKRRK